LQWCLAHKGVIMSAGDLAVLICSRYFHLAPRRFLNDKPGSVKAFRLTRRAADLGYAPRFQAVFVA
jgi:hypothetical protein